MIFIAETTGGQQKPDESGDEDDHDTTMKPLSEDSDEDDEMGEEVSP